MRNFKLALAAVAALALVVSAHAGTKIKGPKGSDDEVTPIFVAVPKPTDIPKGSFCYFVSYSKSAHYSHYNAFLAYPESMESVSGFKQIMNDLKQKDRNNNLVFVKSISCK